ncbi:MAG: ABC transporter permease [Actinomycetota bacterium]|nr:ABC transporter permease [Actinomycetota bacterium]
MKFLKYLGKRIVYVVPQFLGVLVVIFTLVRLVPGDPARLMAGTLVSPEGVEIIRKKMGLTGPIYQQFWVYLKNVFHGDFGKSWYTGNEVIKDIASRLPATLELIVISLTITLLILLPIALKSIAEGKGVVKNIAGKSLFFYGLTAGCFPDFWLGLILILVFFSKLGWLPAPVGQLPIGISTTKITGMVLLDSLVTANWPAFIAHIKMLILPVFVLIFVYGSGIMKVSLVSATSIQKSDYINFAKVCALPPKQISNYVKRGTYPATVTMTALMFGFLIGGAVLVENVFSWGGIGQYAVQSVTNTDYTAIQGVVLIAAVINIVIYVLVDIIYFLVDPRIEKLG